MAEVWVSSRSWSDSWITRATHARCLASLVSQRTNLDLLIRLPNRNGLVRDLAGERGSITRVDPF